MLLIVNVVVMCRYPLVQKKKFRQQNLSERIVAKKDLLIICVKTFGTRCVLIFFGGNIAGENSVQIHPNFPAKSLSMNFFLMENYLTD